MVTRQISVSRSAYPAQRPPPSRARGIDSHSRRPSRHPTGIPALRTSDRLKASESSARMHEHYSATALCMICPRHIMFHVFSSDICHVAMPVMCTLAEEGGRGVKGAQGAGRGAGGGREGRADEKSRLAVRLRCGTNSGAACVAGPPRGDIHTAKMATWRISGHTNLVRHTRYDDMASPALRGLSRPYSRPIPPRVEGGGALAVWRPGGGAGEIDTTLGSRVGSRFTGKRIW
jgi:hypothetical protein